MQEQLSKVNIKLGTTLKIGDYENIRLDVEVDTYVLPDEEIDDAIDRVYLMVEDKLTTKLENATGKSWS